MIQLFNVSFQCFSFSSAQRKAVSVIFYWTNEVKSAFITDNLDFCRCLYLKFSKRIQVFCCEIKKQKNIYFQWNCPSRSWSGCSPLILKTAFMFSKDITMIIKLHMKLIMCQFNTSNRRQSVRLTVCTTSISVSTPATLPSSLQRRRLSQTPN